MTVLLPAILPVSLIVLVGYAAGKTLNLDYQTLSHLAIYILVPALIASSLYRNTLSWQSATGLVAGFTLTAIALSLLVSLVSRGLGLAPAVRMSLLATTLFSNAGNLGLPLVSFALGEAGLERAIVYLNLCHHFNGGSRASYSQCGWIQSRYCLNPQTTAVLGHAHGHSLATV